MRKRLLIVLSVGLAPLGQAQYSYFNIIHGSESPNSPETTANVIADEDGYITFGGGGDADDLLHYFFHRYDEQGVFQESVPYYFGSDFVWTGSTNSFQKIPESDDYLFAQGISDAEGTHGFMMRLDSDFDTLWTKKLELFPPYTYITSFNWDEDGFILSGEFGSAPGDNGTFIAKVDLDGEYLWHQVIHEPDEGFFRNRFISPVAQGYVTSGAMGAAETTEGRVEYFDETGQLLGEFENDQDALLRGIMRHTLFSTGEILVTQYIGYADYPESTDPLFFYTKMSLFRFNIDNMQLEFIGDYFDDDSWVNGNVIKTIESHNDSKIMTGSAYVEIDGEARNVSFIFKLDSEYQLEWYTQLAFEDCGTCINQAYDVEQSADGGYVVVGSHRNWTNDPYDNTWLVKVDACGDVEYQGCAPVGVEEWGFNSNVEIYPNPADDYFNISITDYSVAELIEIFDVSGRKIIKVPFNTRMDVSNLGVGIYLIRILNDKGVIHSEKLIVE